MLNCSKLVFYLCYCKQKFSNHGRITLFPSVCFVLLESKCFKGLVQPLRSNEHCNFCPPRVQICLSFIMQSFNFLDSLRAEVAQRVLMGLLFFFFISWNAALLNTESTACAQVPFLEFDADVWMTNGDLCSFQDVGFESRLITRLPGVL